MIARTWHGIVPLEKKDAYHKYLVELEPRVTHYDVLMSPDTGTA